MKLYDIRTYTEDCPRTQLKTMTDNVDQPSGVIGAEMVQMGAEEVGGQSLQYPSLSGPLPLDNTSHHKNQQFYSK